MKRALAHILAVIGGAATWIVGCRMGGQVEAWDGPIYLGAVLPSLAALAAILGFWLRERPAALGVAASLGQIVGLGLTRGGDAMWPVDVAILAVLAVPLGLCAWIGSGLRRMVGGVVHLGRSGARLCCRRRGRSAVAPQPGLSMSPSHGAPPA